MSLPDQVMLDSPAQTPEAKNPQQSMLRGGGHSSSNMATTMGEVGMMIEDESLGANNSDFSGGAVGSWDNKQWRDELTVVTNKLQHKNFNPCENPLPPFPPGSGTAGP